jgi:hypothetical protein
MMKELTDRYVAATLRTIPEKQRADIEAELRASIGDAVEAKVETGADPVSAERDVLTGLGDPDRLAAGYVGRPGYLIGPDLFFDYRRLLIVLLVTVVPVVAVVFAVFQALAGEGFGSVIGEAVTMGITLIVHITFWTTLVFALMERSGEKSPTGEWSLAHLPAAPTQGSIKLGETISSVVFLVLTIAALLFARTFSGVTAADGTPIPLFQASAWDFWLPFLIVVLAAEIVFEAVKYRLGRWTWGLAWVNLALNVAFAAPAIYLIRTDRLFNPAAFAEIGWGTEQTEPGMVVLVVVIAAIALWDILDGFRRARKVG